MGMPGQQSGPQFTGLFRLGPIGRIGRQIAERRVGQDRDVRRILAEVGDQGAMPIDLVPADLHRRKLKAIAEISTFAKGLGCSRK